MVVKPVTEYFSAEDNVGTMKNGGVPFYNNAYNSK